MFDARASINERRENLASAQLPTARRGVRFGAPHIRPVGDWPLGRDPQPQDALLAPRFGGPLVIGCRREGRGPFDGSEPPVDSKPRVAQAGGTS